MTDLVFNKKDVFSWANAEEARQYIGKEGYFSDVCYSDLKLWIKAELIDISRDSDIASVFMSSEPVQEDDDEPFSYGLFLPTDKVKQKEKKYRPFKTIGEFLNTLNVGFGSVLVYRRKDEPDMEYVSTFTSYRRYKPTGGLYSVLLGGQSYIVKDLLDKYEWYNAQTEEWCSFGVEE